ncbi:tubulin glycylase 3B [Drosophila sulfurigaster albostrigata]|uniref:tubulin glycylase 3B n=1 Tax=Drosophila sulfurigaster albostrigata TaxID=89887 RepID=UPI002D21AF94|nr:tubulin glycylase 3B [Drosophila sulfurigaster albostrigata]
MSQASTSAFNTRNRYYNPVSRIQTLIQNLDAELITLCKQCSMPNNVGGNSLNKSSLLAQGGSQHHTHASSANIVVSQVRPTSITNSVGALAPDAHKRQLRNTYRTRVIDAYRNRRIFTVYGNYHTVRRALVRRGWLEKLPANRHAKLQTMSEDSLLELARRGNEYEAVVLSKMINNFPAFFIWQTKGARDTFPEVKPYRNRVRRSQVLDFSTKVGLVGCAEQERWFREDGICGMSYPRVYRLGANSMEERAAFIEDFHHTQARALLRYIKEHRPIDMVDIEHGAVISTTIDFALNKVKNMIRQKEHYSLDDARIKMLTPTEMVENQSFMMQSSKVLQTNAKFKVNEKVMAEYARLAAQYLDQIESLRSDYRWDGCRNLWILKPGYQSRGIGIVIRNSLDDILQWTSNNQNRKYIVQKYIERPCLIYRTKFDIRQYMLLTISDAQVSIWIYKDCYLRFSSQEFTMDDLRESIHLTNNSVQKRYKNKMTRDSRLPKNNMWSLDQFKCHLRHVGAPDGTWAKIYDGFKQNLTAVVLASLDETELTPNAFEIYGCDFMLDEYYNPILIEINSTPDLSPSTEVTARICPLAVRDCIRVVLDFPRNPMASTGQFERAFQVNYSVNKEQDGTRPLELNGTQMKLFESLPKLRVNHRSGLLRKILNNVTPSNKLNKDKFKEKNAKITGGKTGSKKLSRESSKALDLGIRTTLNSTTRENLALQYTAPK